jgi:hypothetical protein
MKNFFIWYKQQFRENPFLTALITAVIVYVIYRIYLKYSAKQRALKEIDKYTAEVQVQQSVGLNKSYSDSQYNTWAQEIYDANSWYGTDENAIIQILNKMNNSADISYLSAAFGVREGLWYSYNLKEWVQNALSDSEIKTINDLYSSKNINYNF